MATAPTGGEIGQGVKRTVVIYEGDATRTDVMTDSGKVIKGVTYAAQIDDDRIKEGNAYVRRYTTWDNAVQRVAANGNGDTIVGRVIEIDKNTPEISANAGTWTAARATARRGTVEFFVEGQVIYVRGDGSGTTIAVGNKLSLKAASTFLFVQDNTNGFGYVLEGTTDADAWIPVEIINL
jgi:hypothetical protein